MIRRAVLLVLQLALGGAARAQTAPAKATLVPQGEPGEPMVLQGIVLDRDGQPANGALLFLYHTDAKGRYNNDDNGRPGDRRARLSATLHIGADGKFEIRSIRPAPYPGGRAGRIHRRL